MTVASVEIVHSFKYRNIYHIDRLLCIAVPECDNTKFSQLRRNFIVQITSFQCLVGCAETILANYVFLKSFFWNNGITLSNLKSIFKKSVYFFDKLQFEYEILFILRASMI